MIECSNCGTLTKNTKFCSRRCSAIVTNSTHPRRKKINYGQQCKECGKLCKTSSSQYCSQTCISNFKYKEFITLWLNGIDTGLTKTGNTRKYVRRWLIETHGEKCSVCSWCEIHPVTGNIPIELDHIDGNHTNARPENVRLLCPNCHALTPTFRKS